MSAGVVEAAGSYGIPSLSDISANCASISRTRQLISSTAKLSCISL